MDPKSGGTDSSRSPKPPLPPMNLPPPPSPAKGAGPADGAMAAVNPASPGPAIFDDGDLIEKDWVRRAKRIVETTRNDPYKQSEELTALRADYMKKQYGKDIKLSD